MEPQTRLPQRHPHIPRPQPRHVLLPRRHYIVLVVPSILHSYVSPTLVPSTFLFLSLSS